MVTDEKYSKEVRTNDINKPIDWNYWATNVDITPEQAAMLILRIEPVDLFDEFECIRLSISDDLIDEITCLEKMLLRHADSWSLIKLAAYFHPDDLPLEMVEIIRGINPDVLAAPPRRTFTRFDPIPDWVNQGLAKHLTHFVIVDLWATTNGKRIKSTPYEEKIRKAVIDGDLIAEIAVQNLDGGFDVIPYSPTILMQEIDGWLNDHPLQYTINRENFLEWLKKSDLWPLSPDCHLTKWFDTGKQNELLASDGLGSPYSSKPKGTRKRIDNLNYAIYAAIQKIGRKPSLDELWQYFQHDKDNTGKISDFSDNKIVWVDTKGEFHDTQKRSIANRLSKIKPSHVHSLINFNTDSGRI